LKSKAYRGGVLGIASRTSPLASSTDRDSESEATCEARGFCVEPGCRGPTRILVWESSFFDENPRV
jgi:hypothetical protein